MNTAQRFISNIITRPILGVTSTRHSGRAKSYLSAQVKEFIKEAANSPDKAIEDRLLSSATTVTKGSKSRTFVVYSPRQ
ncbi:MAG: hypothetical protein KDD56_10185 [Bdellovibrionales bacterium]|nr:hypothetical protein [Bdellovibrionales bacterium]